MALCTFLQESAEKNEDGLIDCAAHCDAFWFWLKSKGINSYRRYAVCYILSIIDMEGAANQPWICVHYSGIVMAIAEKVNTMLPGIYDAAEFQ